MFESRREQSDHGEVDPAGALELREGGYAVDLVLCIDVTSSMSPVIDTVKRSALTLHHRLAKAMAAKEKAVGSLRIRVVAFRDLQVDRVPLQTGGFWHLPYQIEQFQHFVHGLSARGGGDEPESGLEALALAIGSPWDRESEHRRHVIVMFTDASAHPLGVGRTKATYPADAPKDLDELWDRWGRGGGGDPVMDQAAKRLLVFAPDRDPWTGIAATWNNTLHSPSRAGTGLSQVALDDVISVIAGSV